MRSRAGVLRLVAVSMLVALGCKEREIRAYAAPKDATPSRLAMPPTAPSAPETVSWSLPSGWSELPGEGLRFATLVLEPGANDGSRPALEMRITPLGLAAGDPLANVNRWRQQIGLGPLDAKQLPDVARSVAVDGRQAHLVNMTGAPGEHEAPHQILAAIVPGEQRVWFFMILDHSDRVAKHEQAFEEFVRSVQVQAAQSVDVAQLPEGHPPVRPSSPGADGGATADASGLRWTTPDGWHAHPGNSAFRVVSFHVGDEPADAEVTITRFAGGAGALLPNINRWRGQIGLAPIAALSDQPLDTVQVGGLEGQLLDIVDARADDPRRQRMLVVLLRRDDTTWFVKMTGPYDVLETESPTFVEFARGLRFVTEES